VVLKIAQCFSTGFNDAYLVKVPQGRKKTSAVPYGTFHLIDMLPSLERLGYYQPNQKRTGQKFAGQLS
jgi:hypothetical protein